MTKEAVLHEFFSGFGLRAYPAEVVPSDVVFPYLTYELTTASFGDGETACTVNLWYYGECETSPNAKAQELSAAIGRGGRLMSCDGGALWIKRGAPWCQSVPDINAALKRRYINISVEYLTED